MSGTATVQCWGCRKSETHPIVHGEEFERQREEMESRGWRRRSFGPPSWDKGPWFCSHECATESYNAKQAEAYWEEEDQKVRDEEFQKYCKETPMPFWARNLIIFLICFTVSFLLTRLFQ